MAKVKYEDAAVYVTNAKGWVCKTCRRYWAEEKHMAQWCCATDLPCDTKGCTNRRTKSFTVCKSCRVKSYNERKQKCLDKAKLCEDDGHPFVVDGVFYMDMDEYIDAVEQGEMTPQEYALMTRQASLYLDADSICNDALERLGNIEPGEDIELVGMDEFKAAVETFVAANQELDWWAKDTSRKFKLPQIDLKSKLEKTKDILK